MTSYDHYPSNKELPLEVGNFCSRLHLDATEVIRVTGNQRVSGRLRDVEHEALYHAAILGVSCHRVIEEERPPVLDYLRRDESGEVDARYEVEAAVRMVPAVLPFATGELERLGPMRYRHWEGWIEPAIDSEPQLVARWSDWLRDGQTPSVEVKNRGNASLLHLACSRLAIGLESFLGW